MGKSLQKRRIIKEIILSCSAKYTAEELDNFIDF